MNSQCRKAILSSQLLRVSGKDNCRFLQGQLTCNVEAVTEGKSLQGAYCNIKGRVIADFRLFRYGEDLYLQTVAGMAEKLQQALARFIVFFKAEITIVPEFVHLGLQGPAVQALLQQCGWEMPQLPGQTLPVDGCVLMRQHGDPGHGAQERVEIFQLDGRQPLPDALAALSEDDELFWRLTDIEAGLIHVTPAMSEEYTPQLLNYDLTGVIDFRKGCFPGQEIVARMHYRSKAKKRLSLLGTETLPACLQTVLGEPCDTKVLWVSDARGEPVADAVLAVAARGGMCRLLAVMPVETAGDGIQLRVVGDEGCLQPLTQHPLPYPA